jgi:hypothetical protein
MQAASSDGNTPSFEPSANCASASERASAIFLSAERTFCCTTDSSTILAMKMVQVISEAKARPIITPFTTTSADMNIDHGDSSRGTMKVGFAGAFSTTAGAAVGAVGVAGAAAEGAA